MLLPFRAILALVLKKVLLDPASKKKIIESLKSSAKTTETVWDDQAVDLLDKGWEPLVAAIMAK
jgi:hypothetical protein